MITPPHSEERRFALRTALRLRVIVSGRASEGDGAAWCEPTVTNDVSTSGALFHLNRRVSRGEGIRLRSHLPDGAPVEVEAVVVRVAAAVYGTARVGVRVVEPAEGWVRLFVAWVASEQGTLSGSDPSLTE